MSKITVFIKKIEEKYPSFKIEDYKRNTLGQNNDVIIINDNLIFRFPKYRQGIINLKVETELICRIKNKVSLEIPYPTYKNFKREEVGAVFTGYKMINGDPLFKDIFTGIEDKQTIANQLASFLREIHSIPSELISDIDIPINDNYQQWQNLYKEIKEKLFGYMRKSAKQDVERMFNEFLNKKSTFKPTLVHGDFGPTNILYDNKSNKISGIIDFGSVRFDDPAIDIASLIGPFGYGESFLNMFKDKYSDVNDLLERGKFYAKTFPLQDALFGLEKGDKDIFRAGIKDYI